MYNGGWPNADEVQSIHEQFLLQRAVQSYMMTLPILNVIGLTGSGCSRRRLGAKFHEGC